MYEHIHRHKLNVDLSKKKGSITSVLLKHRDELFSLTSKFAVVDKLKTIFTESKINTPCSRKLLFKIEHGSMNLPSIQLYLSNTMLSGQKLGVI